MTVKAKQQAAASGSSKHSTSSSTSTSQQLDAALVERAVRALLQHHAQVVRQREKQSLLDDEGGGVPVQLLLGLEVAPRAPRPKPIRLAIPHPLHQLGGGNTDNNNSNNVDVDGLEEPEVCLIVKEDSKPAVQEMVAQFPEHLKCIKKVLGLQSLRSKHASYQQRRDLLARYDAFLADDRILPMLQAALGRDFVRTKRLPIPVRITRREALPFAVRRALSATYLHVGTGTCLSVRVGRTGMPVPHLVENIVAAAAAAAAHVPRRWANVRSVAVKLPASQALPVYNRTPAELREIAALAGLPPAWPSRTATGKEEEEPAEPVAVTKEDAEQQVQEKETESTGAKEKKETKNASAALEKSPLLRALKKQKKMESSKDVDHDDATKKEESSSKKKAKHDDVKKSDKKSKKKRSHKEATMKGDDDDDDDDDEPKQQPSASKKSKKKKGEGVQNDESSPSPSKKQSKSVDNNNNEPFIASKRFKGSKPKYVFKMDQRGLGYYLDTPPVPDKMALQALARLSPKQGKGGGSGSKKSKGKRGGRR